MAKATTKQTKQNKGAEKVVSKDLIDAQSAAELLGSSLALIYALRRGNRLKSGVVISKRLYFKKTEIEALKATGTIHPRKKSWPRGVGEQYSKYDTVAQFSVSCSASAYNVMSTLLKNSNLTVADWLSKVVEQQATEAQKVNLLGIVKK